MTPLLAAHEAAGANLRDDAGWRMPADFGDPAGEHRACREGAALIDLSHRGKLRISGADAPKFLHSMLSNRVEDLLPGEGVYAAFLTRQGKFISDLNLYRREEDFRADLAPGMASAFAEAIDMYIIMDEVEIEDRTEAHCALGVFGPGSHACLGRAGFEPGDLPEHGHREAEGASIARELWTGEEGYLLTAPASRAGDIWGALAGAGARPAGLTAFETLTLEAGTPLFGLDMGADINPMQAGLEARAIDFEKGCYVGQEVIAKIKYLGQVNRGLAGIRLEGGRVPPAGAIVEMGGEKVGSLTRAALSPTLGKILAFGLLHRKAMEPGTPLTVRDGGGVIAGEAAALPFYKNEALEIPAQSPPPR